MTPNRVMTEAEVDDLQRQLLGLGNNSGMLKGGQGSGNFGHSGRPGEIGGSGDGGGTAEVKGLTAKVIKEKIAAGTNVFNATLDRSNDAKYVESLQKTHGLKTEFTDSTTKISQLAVHEALATMPKGQLQYMRDRGVVVKTSDEARVFTVGDKEFQTGGTANYKTGELMLYGRGLGSSYDGTFEIVSHESGHFGVSALLSMGAEGDFENNRIEMVREKVRESVMKFGSDSQEAMAFKEERTKLQEAYKANHEPFKDKIQKFHEASMLDEGVTLYSEKYRNSPQGHSNDMAETEMGYRYGGIGSNQDAKGYSYISRFANENFAELTAIAQSAEIGNKVAAYKLASIKDNKPRTYKAFRSLQSKLQKPFKFVKTEIK